MLLTLIGMSCTGKTYWADRLATLGYGTVHCDDILLEQLRLRADSAIVTMEDAGAWMGLPYEPHFREREQIYLACEQMALEEALRQAEEQARAQRSFIVDTGGSVIYTDGDVFERLRRLSTVVYLQISPEVQQEMLRDYLAQPRALIWSGMYRPQPGESTAETFARCYPELIAQRAGVYDAYCHVRVAYAFHRQPGLSPEAFLAYVQGLGVKG